MSGDYERVGYDSRTPKQKLDDLPVLLFLYFSYSLGGETKDFGKVICKGI
jgi:hypothetical protein